MFPVLLAQIKVWNNLYKLKPGTTEIVLYQHNKIATIWSCCYNNGSKHERQQACDKSRIKSSSFWFTYRSQQRNWFYRETKLTIKPNLGQVGGG